MEYLRRLIEISDLRIPEVDVYARMSENQLRRIYEPEPGLFIAESPKVITRALNAGYEPVSFLVCDDLVREAGQVGQGDGSDDRLPGHQNRPPDQPDHQTEPTEHELAARILLRCPDVPVYAAPLPVLEKLTGFHLTLGMLCAMRRKRLPSPEEICRDARRIAVLEDVVNPTNVGAIMRSAAALNMDAVLLTSGCSDPLYRRAARVSVGTVFQVPWTVLPKGWPGAGIKCLKEMGFAAAALALRSDSIPIDDPVLKTAEKLALILGTEGTGLSEETIALCDYKVIVPMKEGIDSLNVAAAAAVAFWQVQAR